MPYLAAILLILICAVIAYYVMFAPCVSNGDWPEDIGTGPLDTNYCPGCHNFYTGHPERLCCRVCSEARKRNGRGRVWE